MKQEQDKTKDPSKIETKTHAVNDKASVSEGLILSSRHTTLVFMYEEDSVENEVE